MFGLKASAAANVLRLHCQVSVHIRVSDLAFPYFQIEVKGGSLMRKSIFGLLVFALSLASVGNSKAKQGPGTRGSHKDQMIAEVQSLPNQQVSGVNAEGAPLAIQAASVREIQQATFLGLTGQPTVHSSMSTYPDIALVNTSGKTIASFMIIFKSKVEGGNHYALTKAVSIASGGGYTFASKRWLLEEKFTVKKDDGTFKSVMRKPGPDSAKFWIPGAASDLHVMVYSVVFEDGSQWRVPENFDW
jgi:hypothetical protein